MATRERLPEDAECRQAISVDEMAAYYRAHRRLGGRTAADLAAGGIYLRDDEASGPVDVAGILASLPEDFDDPGDDPWGGANLDPGERFDSDGIVEETVGLTRIRDSCQQGQTGRNAMSLGSTATSTLTLQP